MTCPSCRRSYDAGKKFCAFDGEELVPLTVAVGGAELAVARFAGALGKICPSCSRRYEADATFCGRDGAELVSVN
jgi:predicted amidophosphoribosyltransferase